MIIIIYSKVTCVDNFSLIIIIPWLSIVAPRQLTKGEEDDDKTPTIYIINYSNPSPTLSLTDKLSQNLTAPHGRESTFVFLANNNLPAKIDLGFPLFLSHLPPPS